MPFREGHKPQMRLGSICAVGLAAIVVSGCITFSAEPTATPYPAPTEIPMVTPAPTPAPATPEPTAGPPTPTPDPNATPRPTAVDVAPYLTSDLTVINLGDATLRLTVALLDPDSTDEFVIGTFEIQPEQVNSQAIIPALFRLDFGYSGVADAGSCTITIADGEQLQFAVVPQGVAITTSGPEPADPAEMIVATASRCQPETGS
jgi:hypothetical protein